MSDLGKKEGYYELLRPLFDNDNQYLGTQVLDNPKKDEYAELFYDIGSLIERRPLTTDKTQWTDEQKQVVEKLRESWIFAYWDGMGSEMEWEILKALFTENGEDYLGVLSSEHADWLGLTRTSPVQM